MRSRRPRTSVAAAACAAALLGAGCHEPVTEIVVVVHSDVQAQDPWLVMITQFVAQPERPHFPVSFPNGYVAFPQGEGPQRVPASFVLISGGQTQIVSGIVALYGNLTNGDTVLIERAISDLHFVPHETRMLVLNLGADCVVCHGTACPDLTQGLPRYQTLPDLSWSNASAALPGCDLVNPPLDPLDPTIAMTHSGLSWEP